MIREMHCDEQEMLISKLAIMEGFKYLQEQGKDLSFLRLNFHEIDNYDEGYPFENVFVNVLEALGFSTEWNMASDERGESKGYTLFYDEDECTIEEVVIKHPSINKYLDTLTEKYIKSCMSTKKGSEDEFDPQRGTFASMVSDLTFSGNYMADYIVYESFVPDDMSGVCFLLNSYDFLTEGFIVKISQLIDYCKEQNSLCESDKRTEVDVSC